MSTPTERAPQAPRRTWRDWLRDPRVIALIGVGLPTLLITLIMSGFIGQVQAKDAFPFFSIDLSWPTMLVANTPTGGDMGAHVLLPAILRDDLLPAGRLMGWSNDWYAGFPALYFYFPLPALFTVLLDVLLPYGVAFKITASLGVMALPLGVYIFARGIGYTRLVATITAATGSMYVFMESFSIFGGNIKSTMAGEFSFAWSLSLSLMYLGVVLRDTRNGGKVTPLAGVLLAATALSHIVTTIVIVAVSLPVLLRRRGWKVLTSSWALGLGLAAIWALPFALSVFQGLTTDMKWDPVTGIVGGGPFAGTTATPLPNEFIPVFALAVIGVGWSLARRDRVAVPLTMTVAPFVGYVLLQGSIDFTKVYNARLLPYWYLGCFIFAGIAIGLGVVTLARWVPQRSQNLVVGTGLVLVILAAITVAGIHDVPGWVRWNYSGYEGKDSFDEYRSLMTEIDALPAGRVMWEANSDLGRYGTPMSLMLIPYWTDDHPSMEGLLFESSLTTPFHFLNASEVSESPSNPVRELTYRPLNFERAVEHLALYDVSYYVAWTDRAKSDAAAYGLELISVTGPFEVYALPDADLIDIATLEPMVYTGDEAFLEAALSWYDDIENLDRWLVAEGPEDWPETRSTEGPFRGGDPIATRGEVSDLEFDDQRISFRTTAVGVPHLVKVSYFPNWKATGADGPYRAAPSLMVIVPTEEEVVLEFTRSWAEYLGMISTFSVGGALIVFAVRRRRRGPAAAVPELPVAVGS